MISKNVFLQKVEELQILFGHEMTEGQFHIYYETLSPDFTDDAFVKTVAHVVKTSFKFPPIAAFYRDNPEVAEAFSPVTTEESARLRKVLAEHGQ